MKTDPDKGKSEGKKTSRAASSAATSRLLTDSRQAYQAADWPTLAALADKSLSRRADRDRLALLAAAGLAQEGQLEAARSHLEQARDWGCPPRLIAEILISGAFNSLGRAACLMKQPDQAETYFGAALETAPAVSASAPVPVSDDPVQNARNRVITETAALGLLPEAARGMKTALDRLLRDRHVTSAEAVIFQSQIQLLNHMLSLAQQRGQLTGPGPAKSAPKSPAGAATAPDPADLASRAVSQLGQDLWVLEQTGYKRGGFFVEFGATDGVLLSNTYLLETEFDWTGILAEPNPAFFARLQKNRSCTVSPDCIMGESGDEVTFILADEYGGVADFADTDSHVERRRAFQEANHVLRLPTISLDDFLRKYNAPRRIDYLSVDTEGTEFEILQAFPFENWDIGLLTIEHNFTPQREDIHALLSAQGYTRIEAKWDDWYVKTNDAT